MSRLDPALAAGASAASLAPAPALDPPVTLTWSQPGRKLAALVELTKPRIAVMVLLTVAVGFFLGARDRAHALTFLVTLVGTGLVAGGASAWNQVLERSRDTRMRRTRSRPLPSGRVATVEAAVFGTALGLAGIGLLLLGANPAAAAVAGATFALYVLLYTPLKAVTTLNTAIGAVPGALPPVIGYAAATGRIDLGAAALFLVLFLWQFPHFLAIAWLYRDDYVRGGLKMLPIFDPTGALTSRQAVAYALALVPAGLLPTTAGLAGHVYFVGALLLGVAYLAAAIRFHADVTDATARRLLRASFLYLPAILLLLLLDPMPV